MECWFQKHPPVNRNGRFKCQSAVVQNHKSSILQSLGFQDKMQFVSDLHLELRKPKHCRLFAQKLIAAATLEVFGLILAGDIGHVPSCVSFWTIFMAVFIASGALPVSA